jgi:hypothetical protein
VLPKDISVNDSCQLIAANVNSRPLSCYSKIVALDTYIGTKAAESKRRQDGQGGCSSRPQQGADGTDAPDSNPFPFTLARENAASKDIVDPNTLDRFQDSRVQSVVSHRAIRILELGSSG